MFFSSPSVPPIGASIVVGLSGGVDSAVSALLLKEQGWTPVGITLWLSGGDGDLPPESGRDARAVADHLGIEHHLIDARKIFSDRVIDPFVRAHWNHHTPNPCVGCNADIKWGVMRQWGRERGIPWFSTGHYVRREMKNGVHLLGRAADRVKDQSYFLWKISPEELSHSLFPLDGWSKPEVRQKARENGIPIAVKRDSQDVCFLPDGEREQLLRIRGEELGLSLRPGEIIGLDGKTVGTHEGLPLYTRGQRQGLGVAVGKKVWAREIDHDRNAIRLGGRDELYEKELVIKDSCWHLPVEEVIRSGDPLTVQLRYRSPEILCWIEPLSEGRWKVSLDQAAWAITPGQSAVFRSGDWIVGGGIIAANGE